MPFRSRDCRANSGSRLCLSIVSPIARGDAIVMRTFELVLISCQSRRKLCNSFAKSNTISSLRLRRIQKEMCGEWKSGASPVAFTLRRGCKRIKGRKIYPRKICASLNLVKRVKREREIVDPPGATLIVHYDVVKKFTAADHFYDKMRLRYNRGLLIANRIATSISIRRSAFRYSSSFEATNEPVRPLVKHRRLQ